MMTKEKRLRSSTTKPGRISLEKEHDNPYSSRFRRDEKVRLVIGCHITALSVFMRKIDDWSATVRFQREIAVFAVSCFFSSENSNQLTPNSYNTNCKLIHSRCASALPSSKDSASYCPQYCLCSGD